MKNSDGKIWRIVDLLKWSRNYLSEKGVESPQIEAEWMLRHVLNLSRLEIYLNHERPLTATELADFKSLLIQRSRGIPIQYLLGYTEFMGHRFKVNPAVLIPRPETELLVEKVVEIIENIKQQSLTALDVGTGSGCIAVSMAIACRNCRISAIDISPEALAVARQNAVDNGVADRILFQKMDILNDRPAEKPFNIIASNPPYVAGEYWNNLTDLVKNNEPRIALYPGKDGLIFYRRLTRLAQTHLTDAGYLITEIGGTYQEQEVHRIFHESGLRDIEIIRDYSGESRIVLGKHCP
ncbi:MAG: peptide chain release factor N(5)-glutamine methyltransferase [Candidatus Neomarinimicrobiota bacterium]|nr:MAG: peptide chain release factor N(5)-glutamine methyltransferase [Candidatus Neomarinimicrobiota bacterium]